MTKSMTKERRRFPRIAQNIPVNIIANGYDFVTTTENVSCVGTYCRVDKYIPPFTKIAVKLNLPIATNDGGRHCTVECRGVVVRTDDENNGGFNIAVFFNHITDNHRKKISQYINQFIPQKSSRLKSL